MTYNFESLFTTNIMNVGRFESRSSAGRCRLWEGMRLQSWVEDFMCGEFEMPKREGFAMMSLQAEHLQ